MSLVKKVTSAVASLAIVFSIVSPVLGVNAAYTSLEAANKLATLGVIVDNSSNPSDYRLGDTITRREMLKIMMKLSTVTVDDSCEGKFADLPASDWGCKYAEAALANGMIAANANFRPNDNVSKIEALKMIFKARGIEREDNVDWKAGYVNTAVAEGLITSAFSDYDTAAERGWIFTSAVNAVEAEDVMDEEDDLLGDLLGGLDDEEDTTTEEDMTEEDMTEDDTTVVVSDNMLAVSLSPETPASATIPGNISGLPVAKFDFTAGTEDVTVTTLTVKRRGLSDADTLTALAAFSPEGRISKSKNDSQENDTQALLTLSNGGLVIQAGETVTVTIVADINDTAHANGAEFAIELLDIEATSDIKGVDSLVANTMKVGGVDAATIVVDTDGTFSDVKVGDDQAEIFKFKITGDNNSDVILNSITFKGEGSVNEEDDLVNYELWYDDAVVSTATAIGKYVTFNIEDGLTIREDKNEKFYVTADVIGGVTETIEFKVDKNLDVSAEDTKYGYGANVDITAVDAAGDLGTLNIDAGELTLSDIDAASDKIRANKNNVELGSIKVTNVSGAALELWKIAIDYSITSTDANYDSAVEIFENFEVEINGTSYEIEIPTDATATSGSFTDTDLDVVLPEGVTEMVLRADTKENVPADVAVDLSVTNIGSGGAGFYAVEMQEEEPVEDVVPSSLSFKRLTFIEAGATLSAVPLADVTVVRGTSGVVANQFEIKASEASMVEIDELKADVQVDGAAATNLEINEVVLYRGSVSDANRLDSVSGTQLASGIATFNGFKVSIDANETETFIVTVSIVDGTDPVGHTITVDVAGADVSAEDDDTDDVTVTGDSVSNKDIVVTDTGSVTIADDANNDANKDPKVILAGTDEIVFSADVYATNEEADVETVTFTVDTDLTDAAESASLYLNGNLIATNTHGDITATTIAFTDLTNFIVPEENVEVELRINSATIGYEKVGTAIAGASVTDLAFTDVTGVDSGKDITVTPLTTTVAETFDIVPATITPSVAVSLNSSTTPQIQITADAGDNTVAASNTSPSADIDTITFSLLGTTDIDSSITYELVNVDDSTISVTGVVGGGNVVFDLTDGIFDAAGLNSVADGSSETFKLVITGADTDADTVQLTLPKDGIVYNVDTTTGITTNMSDEIDFGSRTY